MPSWENFIRDVLKKTILSGEYEWEGPRKLSDKEVSSAIEKLSAYLSSPDNTYLLRSRGRIDPIIAKIRPVMDFFMDPVTGMPNADLAGTVVFKWSPSWFKTWLGESIRRHPRIKDIVRRIEREWEHLGMGATRDVWGKDNVVAKLEYEPPITLSQHRPNVIELVSSLILRKNLPKTEELARLGSSGIIIPKPYAFVKERTRVPPYSILFSQRVPFEHELTGRGYPILAALEETARRRGVFREFDDLATAIDASMFFDDAARYVPGGVILNMGVLNRGGAPKHVLFDLGAESPVFGEQITRKLREIILDTLGKSVRSPVDKVYLVNIK